MRANAEETAAVSTRTTTGTTAQPTGASTSATDDRTPDHAFTPRDGQQRCGECEGRIVTEDDETYCADCGLVVVAEQLDQNPTLSVHGPDEDPGGHTWNISQTTGLQLGKGLGSQFSPDVDGHGNPLTGEQWELFERLHRRDKRYHVPGNRKRSRRLGDSYKEIKFLGSELGAGCQ